MEHFAVRRQLEHLYGIMDETIKTQGEALKHMKGLGRNYPEIRQFMKIPGVGEIGAHVFDGFIQTPDRFPGKRQIWRYARLGVVDRSSDGKLLGYKRLDRSGVSELKDISYRAWMTTLRGDNEVKHYYQKSLQRTCSRVHARLNTQRKILAVMYGVWRKGDEYRAELFSGSSN